MTDPRSSPGAPDDVPAHARDTAGFAIPPDGESPEPPALRRLRLLVSLLTAVLIIGMITVSATLVIRLGGLGGGTGPAAPDPAAIGSITAAAITLPGGEEAVALGRSAAEILVLTRDGQGLERLRAFDAETGAERSVTRVRRGP